MCGRYSITATDDELESEFGVAFADHEPRFNVAPTQAAPVVRLGSDGEHESLSIKWGFTPRQSPVAPLINARVETAAHRNSFRESFRHRRCLVPATGFYEWKSRGEPILFRRRTGDVFALAGLWTSERDDLKFTLLTGPAQDPVVDIHHRMPIILPVEARPAWLDASLTDADAVDDLLSSLPTQQLTATAVSPYVNKAVHEGPECWQPAAEQLPLI